MRQGKKGGREWVIGMMKSSTEETGKDGLLMTSCTLLVPQLVQK